MRPLRLRALQRVRVDEARELHAPGVKALRVQLALVGFQSARHEHLNQRRYRRQLVVLRVGAEPSALAANI
jgi:hypothetical protein